MQRWMMEFPLTLHPILDRARQLFGRKEIVSGAAGGATTPSTYAEVGERIDRLATVLQRLGVRHGDRVGTLCWNHRPHLELYFAAPCIGAVLHTINFRLFADQIAFIVNDAEDCVLFVDAAVLPVLLPLVERLPSVRQIVVVGDIPDELGEAAGRPVLSYERLLDEAEPCRTYPTLHEDDAAAMCYTSGTTDSPKGVMYSHRALVLHAIVTSMPDVLALSERDVVMPVVPMFHVNAWGLPYAATLVGATQVLPGVAPSPSDLIGLIEAERVTITAGVPTVWLGVLAELDARPRDVRSLARIVCGGSAAPRAMMDGFQQRHGVPIWHAWGMTELSPIGSVSHLKSYLDDAPEDERGRFLASQGTPIPLVQMRTIDDAGQDVPWDGRSLGELIVRGPCVTAGYFNDPHAGERFTEDGWFRTGDVVSIDPEGYFEIADRSKDLVKSGGEWISSIALENALVGHPAVAEACVIAVPHPRWGERPLAYVVVRPGHEGVPASELIDFLRPRFAKWWLPDDVVAVDSLPRTGVGKLDKRALRERFKEHKTPRQSD